MNTKSVVLALAVAIIAGGAGYYEGQKSASPAGANLPGQPRAFSGNRQGGGRGGSGSAFGQVVSKDANSITVKLLGGPAASSTNGGTGSKIVLYNPKTEVSKTVSGSQTDLQVGSDVMVNGTANSDGSITAQMIQIRPAGLGFPGGGSGGPGGMRPPQGQ